VKITLKLFASLSVHLPVEARSSHRLELEVEAGATVADVIQRQGLPPGQCAIVLVDGVWVAQAERAQRALAEGEVLAIWPPVAGG
jgi:sulfur carrier protein ThiS